MIDLEKAKIDTVEQEKKRELEQLIADREALRIKEQEMLGEIENLDKQNKQLDQMRLEEVNKLTGVVDELQNKRFEYNKIDNRLLEEKSEKVATLRVKRQQLE